ncbi:OmpA family protein [Dechloromonas sp. ZY10]|uniref:OmpA family protein n=1 Tax=Dechloromonas aquae TaxID=2664436 RepID=UPI003528BB3D
MSDLSKLVTAALLSGSIYFLIWLLFRINRHRKFKRIKAIHAKERLDRADFHSSIFLIPSKSHRQSLRRYEMRRIAEWEAQNGLLSDNLALSQLEESYWTTGAAIQGASAVGTAVLVGMLVWGPHRFSRIDVESAPAHAISSFDQSTSYIGFLQSTVPFLVIAAVMGALIVGTSRRIGGKAAGGILLCGSVAIIGKVTFDVRELSLIKIDKPSVHLEANADVKISEKKTESHIEQTLDFEQSEIILPSFNVASHVLTPAIRCHIDRLLPILKRDSGDIVDITVISSADRRDLLPSAKRMYSSNWGLARKRADSIFDSLLNDGIPSNKLHSQSIGPSHTSTSVGETELGLDRRTTIRVRSRTSSTIREILNVSDKSANICRKH